MNEKTYTVKEFCKTYNNASSNQVQDTLVKSVMNAHYVPYEVKITICNKIIESSYYEKDKDTNIKKMHVNSPSKYLLYCLYVVNQYTYLNVDFTNCLEEFNLLNKCELLDAIYSKIPEKELKELRMILDMVESDVLQNEYETHAFISKQVERFGDLFGHILEPALNKIAVALENIDEKTIEKAINKLNGFNGLGGLKNKMNIVK